MKNRSIISNCRSVPIATSFDLDEEATMVYLDRNAFINELTKLYAKHKKSGSVWMTMKRVKGPIVTGKEKLEDMGPVCIVRASDGKKKLQCIVPLGEHLSFHMDLFTVIKANTEALKRPKRNRIKKTKAT